jgi:acyl-CoA thioesterase
VVGRDPFATFLGIEVIEVRDAYAKVALKIRDDYCNAGARGHGGALFTLADQAFAVAANSRGYMAYGMEMKINYFQAANPGETLTAVAEPVDIRRRVSLWNITLFNQIGDKVAVAQGMAYHFIE